MKLDTKEFEARMKKSISVYEEDLDGIRVGRANPSLLAKINVDYYGSPTPINNVAEVKVTDARTIVIQPWEAKLLKDIGKAIQAIRSRYYPYRRRQGHPSLLPRAQRGAPPRGHKADRETRRGGKGRYSQYPPRRKRPLQGDEEGKRDDRGRGKAVRKSCSGSDR